MKHILTSALAILTLTTLYGQAQAPERQNYFAPYPKITELFPLYGDVETLSIKGYAEVYNKAEEVTSNTALHTLTFRFNKQGDVISMDWWFDEARPFYSYNTDDEGPYRITYTYNSDNLITKELRTSIDTLSPRLLSFHTFTYDEYNRLTTKTLYNAKGFKSRTHTYSYNKQGNLLEYHFYNNKGEEINSTTYAYDDRGVCIDKRLARGGNIVEIEQYIYDERGLKIEHRYLRGDSTPFRVHKMQYNRKGQLTDSISYYPQSKHNDSEETTYTYDRKGRVKTKITKSTRIYNETRTNTYTYKKDHYIETSIFTHDDEIHFTGSHINNYQCIYDNDGKLIRKEWYYPSGEIGYCYTYEYNTQNQLIHSTALNNDWHEIFTPGYEEKSFTYDQYGNCNHIVIKQATSPDADRFTTQHIDYIITYRNSQPD